MERVGWIPRFWEDDARFAWLAPVARCFATSETFPSVDAWTEHLGTFAQVRFETQPPRGRRRRRVAPDALYDARISREGVVPSRAENWHDFLNALVWAAFPRAKRALHARQHRAIAARIDPTSTRLPESRTRELDALAILDEGGVIVLAREPITRDDALLDAINRGAAQPIVFGHAIYEGFVRSGPTPTARCVILPDAPLDTPRDTQLAWSDAALAARLEQPDTFADPASMPLWTVRRPAR